MAASHTLCLNWSPGSISKPSRITHGYITIPPLLGLGLVCSISSQVPCPVFCWQENLGNNSAFPWRHSGWLHGTLGWSHRSGQQEEDRVFHTCHRVDLGDSWDSAVLTELLLQLRLHFGWFNSKQSTQGHMSQGPCHHCMHSWRGRKVSLKIN